MRLVFLAPAFDLINTMVLRRVAVRAGIATLGLISLCACSPDSKGLLQTLRHAYESESDTGRIRLNPDFSYLRITLGKHVEFMARGYVDAGVEGVEHGPVEVWYSAGREVLRLQNGRLVGTGGLTTDWVRVALPELPSWKSLANLADGLRWSRVRDVMPGYRFGVRDDLALRVIPAPEKSALRGVDPRALVWFEETLVLLPETPYPEFDLPSARYAVDFREGEETVVYGEQCLSADFCFAWQRWQAAQQSPAADLR